MARKSKREIEHTLDDLEPTRKGWPADADPFELYELADQDWEAIPGDLLSDAWRNALKPDNDPEE